MSDVGTYSLAYQMASLMVIFAAATMQAWTPLLYSLLRINNTESKNKVKLATAWFIVLFLTIGTVLYFASDFIFELLISPKYFGAKIYFPWLLIGFVCQSIYFIFARVFFFYKKTLMLSVNTLSLATVNLVLNYTLIVRYGTVGVAYATAITWFIFMFIIGLSSSRLIERSCNGSLAA